MSVLRDLGLEPRPGSASWSPSDLGASLLAWWKADAGITEAGTGVSAWADQSGNGVDLAQADDAKRPTLEAAQQNGVDTLRFSAAAFDELSGALSQAQPFSYYVAGEFVTILGASNGPLISGDAAVPQLYHPTGAATANLFAGSVLAGPAFSAATWAVFSCLLKGASSWSRINLGTKSTGDPGAGAIGTEISVGGKPDASESADSRIGEVLLTAELSADNDTAVVNYLTNRWGI